MIRRRGRIYEIFFGAKDTGGSAVGGGYKGVGDGGGQPGSGPGERLSLLAD
jgi:hypothetical protein